MRFAALPLCGSLRLDRVLHRVGTANYWTSVPPPVHPRSAAFSLGHRVQCFSHADVDVSVPCGASVDKRKELAEALRELDANPMRKKTLLLDLKRHFSLSSKIIGIPIQEAFNNVRKELKILQEMHNSASRKPSNAACIAATGVPAAPVDKRKELADALHDLDADSRKDKTKLFDLKKKFALSTRIRGKDVSTHEAFTHVRKELETLQQMHNSASGTANTAACVTATGVPTDAAFTSQVPSAGESSATGVPPD